jgi:hypothetical protein
VGTEDSDALGRSMARGRVRPAAEVEAMGGNGGAVVVVGGRETSIAAGAGGGQCGRERRGTCGGRLGIGCDRAVEGGWSVGDADTR